MLSAGRVVAVGPPAEVFDRDALVTHFRVDGDVMPDPATGL